jgi:hypothetical protein
MSGTRRALVLALFTSGFLLAACGDSPPEEAAAAPAATTARTPKVAGLSPDMVAAVSAGRSATVISVHFALGKPPVIGQALPVDIAIVPHQDFSSVQAHFDGVDGLAVTVGTAMEPVTDVKTESILKHQLVLLPTREGVFMISATVETISRVFSLPMVVAAAETPEPAPTPAAPPPQ